MILCISSPFGASMKAKPFDSCVSGFRMTLIESATRLSAWSQDLMSSAVTQVGRFPRKTVQLILWYVFYSVGIGFRDRVGGAAHGSTLSLTHSFEAWKELRALFFTELRRMALV